MSGWSRAAARNAAVVLAVLGLGSPALAQIAFEAESLAVTNSGTGTSEQTDANTSGGKWVSLDAENSGSWYEFTLPGVPAGTYTLRLAYKGHNNRGQLSARVNGATLPGTLDQYASPASYPTASLGTVTFAASGSQKVRLVVQGKRSASSGYVLSADRFVLESAGTEPTPTPTPTQGPGPSPATPTPTPTQGSGSPVTDGWTQMSWTYTMHKPYNQPLENRFSYSGGVWTTWVFPDDPPFQPPPKEGGPRTELRWQNDYTSGQRMWDSDVWVLAPTRSTIMQLFGGSESQTGSQIRSFEDGTLRRYTSGNIYTNAFGKWLNIKVAHNVSTHTVRIYAGDELKRTDPDRGPPSNVGAYYFKNGLYGCSEGRCEARFRNTKQWRR